MDGVLYQSLVATQDWKPEVNWDREIPYEFDIYADSIDELSHEQKRDFVRDMLWRTTPVARDLWLESNEYRGADRD